MLTFGTGRRVAIALVALAAALGGAGCAGGGAGARATSPATPPHAGLPDRDWGAPVDFAALRHEFGERPDFAARCSRDRPVHAVATRLQERDWEGTLVWVRPWLNGCPVDIQMHGVAAQALFELSMPVESSWHAAWYRGLLDSILASGDGESEDTAWVVISVTEEYATLGHLGYEVLGQSLTPRRRDAMRVRHEGREFTVYFHPEAHFRRLERALAPSGD